MAATILSNAVALKMNVIVTTEPGRGIVNSTLEELRKISQSILVVDPRRIFGGVIPLTQSTEIVVFDDLHEADDELLVAAAELVETRALAGTSFPNLTSIVAFIRDEDDNDAALATGFANLAPTVSVVWG